MDASSEIVIREFAHSDSTKQLTELLRRAYSDWRKKGIEFPAASQTESDTRKKIAEHKCLVALERGEIVGTILYYGRMPGRLSKWYSNPNVVVFGRFAVEPREQSTGVGTKLLSCVERLARADHASELALDTARDAVKLVKWYEERGFRVIEYDEPSSPIVATYRSVIMSKTL